LEAINVARYDAEAQFLVPISDVHVYPSRDTECLSVTDKDGNEVPGFHFDLEFYGGSAVTLTKPTPEGGWPDDADLFDRTYINELVAGRLGEIPGWVASAGDPVPPGYAVNNVRAFDPALIATRQHGWV
jgi:hypothetical protein